MRIWPALPILIALVGCSSPAPEVVEPEPECVSKWTAAAAWWSCNRNGYDGPGDCPQWQDEIESRCAD